MDIADYINCPCCKKGFRGKKIRLIVKNNPTGKPYPFHTHQGESLDSVLSRLCNDYPEAWKKGVVYYFHVKQGGIYHAFDAEIWLRDHDDVVVTTVKEIGYKQEPNLRAIHASLRDGIKLRPHQVDGLKAMVRMEIVHRGGILADEMGLGKTIQILAVISYQQTLTYPCAPTLIITPSHALCDQWADEIRSKLTFGSLPYFIYRETSVEIINQPWFAVIITTYDRVRVEYKKREEGILFQSPLFDIDWYRIVLDESHKLREKTMLTSAINSLQGKFKWCLSGTPIQNDITELYPIFEFLGVELDQQRKNDQEYITDLLKDHMIRRTKTVLQKELAILPKKENRVTLEFSAPEKALYEYLERLLYYQLSKMKTTNGRNHRIASATTIYLRLKQVCGHHRILVDKFPDLIPMAYKGNDSRLLNELSKLQVAVETNYWDEASEYQEALGVIESYYDQFGNLQEPIDMSQLQMVKFIKHSTKITWLVRFLQKQLGSNSHEKIVVVSQFVDMINKICETLKVVKIHFESYYGDMNASARRLALHRFNFDPKTRVMVMSLKAGGIGLNLQRANHMIILDRWWNPATMDQAISRIHRMNQLKETFIHTVVMKDTVEESLMDAVLAKKNTLFQKIIAQQSNNTGKKRVTFNV